MSNDEQISFDGARSVASVKGCALHIGELSREMPSHERALHALNEIAESIAGPGVYFHLIRVEKMTMRIGDFNDGRVLVIVANGLSGNEGVAVLVGTTFDDMMQVVDGPRSRMALKAIRDTLKETSDRSGGRADSGGAE